MSIRGLYGFRYQGSDKLMYNQQDSYPDKLGYGFAEFAANHNEEQLKELFSLIRLVPEDTKVTDDQFAELKRSGFLREPLPRKLTWYYLLAGTQGNFSVFDRVLSEHIEYPMPDGQAFIHESIYCEYAYIINLDTGMFEYWRGFQKDPDPNNRYSNRPVTYMGFSHIYYPCKMVAQYPLAGLKASDVLRKMNRIL